MAEVVVFSGEERYRTIAGTARPTVFYYLKLGPRATPVLLGIIDSGADYVTVPQVLAHELGLNPATLPTKRFLSPSGQEYALPTAPVTLVCSGMAAEVEVIFSGFQYAFLGRAGFFQHFIFGLDETHQRVLIHRRES